MSDYDISGTVLGISNVLTMHFLDTGRGNPQTHTATYKKSYKMTRVLDKTTSWTACYLKIDSKISLNFYVHKRTQGNTPIYTNRFMEYKRKHTSELTSQAQDNCQAKTLQDITRK